MEKNNLSVPIAIVIAGILISSTIFYTNKNPTKALAQQQPEAVVKDVKVALPTAADRISGNLNADVVVIEYSDTECPFCKTFHTTLQQIMNKYGKDGKVAWVYRYFPLDSIHKKARNEAQAAECARDQGGNDMFWKYINEIYSRTKSNDLLPETELIKIATDLKLDVKKWSTCLSSGAKASIVKASEQTGIDAGVRGTPNSFFIFKNKLSKKAIENLTTKYPNGKVKISNDGKIVNFGGAMSYNSMTFVIDNALNDK